MNLRPRVVLAAAAALTALTLTLAGCGGSSDPEAAAGGDPVSGGTLDWALPAEPAAGGLDPMIGSALAAQSIMAQSYQSLFVLGEGGSIEPMLATDYEQPDDVTLVVNLRDDVTFADGTPFTADDVVYSFETYKTATVFKGGYLSKVDSIEATGEHQVTFHLSGPDAALLNSLAGRLNFFIVGREGYGNATPEEREVQTYGTGPYQVTDWEQGVSVTLERNENYWEEGELPYMDGIVFHIITDEATRLAALQQGTVEGAAFLDGGIAQQAADSGFTLGELGFTQNVAVLINPTSGPLSDLRVRQAISLALDRQALVDTAMFGFAEVAGAIPSGDPNAIPVDDDTPLYTRDVEAAKELLAEAGQPNPTIGLTYFGDVAAAHHPIYELMQQQLAEAGITLDLRPTPISEMAPVWTTGESFDDLISIPGGFAADPTGYFTGLLQGGSLDTWTDKPEAEEARALLAEAQVTSDPDARAELFAQLNDSVLENVLVLVPLALPVYFEVWDADALVGFEADFETARYRLTESWLVP